jgi:sirohydrochlorin cobaltochelatase
MISAGPFLRVPRALAVPFVALPALTSTASSLHAQAAAPDEARTGTLIVAHGGGPDWNRQVEALAAEVKLTGPVGVSFLMGAGAKSHRFQDVARDLERRGARRIIVVPLLVSSHSGHYEQIRYLAGEVDTLDATMLHHLHMSGIERSSGSLPLRLAKALDDAPEVAQVLATRALALTDRPAERALFLVGHGPNSAEDYAAWMDNLRRRADTVKARTGFRSVLVELVRDDAPPAVRAEAVTRVRELIRLQRELTGHDVVLVPVLVATGMVSREKLPKDLEGLPVIYSGDALLESPDLAPWVVARVRAAAATSSSVP